MPSCRSPLPSPVALPKRGTVRLGSYVVTRRLPPRAANDNRRGRSGHAWQWAVAIGVAPALTALLLLSGLF